MPILVIYDNDGIIYYQAKGSVKKPNGLQFMWVEDVDGQFIESIDVSNLSEPKPIYKSLTTQQNDEINKK